MIKQFVPGKVCVKCLGCCRFIEADSVWQPVLLESEAKVLAKSKKLACGITQDKKICLVPSKSKDIFYCAFFDAGKNKCGIYMKRPLDCQLYPFLINRRDEKVFLSVDLNCPFINENINSKPFQKYAGYLAKLLINKKYRGILKNNPRVIQCYPQAKDIVELDL